jgi:hypothetical protein
MRSHDFAVALGCAVVLATFGVEVTPCRAQTRSGPGAGPATLESLITTPANDAPAAAVKPSTASQPAAQLPAEDAPARPHGVLVRPADGVKHPALDAAWTDYESSVRSALHSLRGVIAKRFETAAGKGDLAAVEKWQEIADKFDSRGILPTGPDIKAAVGIAESTLKKSRDELVRAYDTVVKDLTMARRIEDAKAARTERDDVMSGKSIPPRETPWADITSSMEGGERLDGLIVLHAKKGERSISKDEYSPPVEIEYVCETARNNIRLGFACDEMTFNWDKNHDELRIDGGPANRQHVANGGALPEGRLVTIRQRVLPGEMRVSVDGKDRATWSGDFSGVKERIEIFGRDSDVSVQQIRVRRPAQETGSPPGGGFSR